MPSSSKSAGGETSDRGQLAISQLEAVKKRNWMFIIGGTLLYLLILLWWLFPVLFNPQEHAARLISKLGDHGTGIVSAGPLVDFAVTNGVYSDWYIRLDVLFAYIGFGIALATGAFALLTHTEARFFEDALQSRSDPRLESLDPDKCTPETIVWSDAVRAELRASQMRRNANYSLFLGLVMAAVGLVIFYVSMPAAANPLANPTRQLTGTEWLHAGRSFGMLLFVESIAIFLLRQHRALMEDFKDLYRMYMRRANYLLCFKLGKTESARIQQLVTALLAEDFSRPPLDKDQTTEAVEMYKVVTKQGGALQSAVEKLADKVDKIRIPSIQGDNKQEETTPGGAKSSE